MLKICLGSCNSEGVIEEEKIKEIIQRSQDMGQVPITFMVMGILNLNKQKVIKPIMFIIMLTERPKILVLIELIIGGMSNCQTQEEDMLVAQ
ncbi:MAG: hypothetical protein OHK0057_35070 [Thermoflexibacter sp.]